MRASRPSSKSASPNLKAGNELKGARAIIILVGLALAAAGGTVAYRAAFVEPSTAIVISEEGIDERPNTPRIVGGLALAFLGAGLAFYAARRR